MTLATDERKTVSRPRTEREGRFEAAAFEEPAELISERVTMNRRGQPARIRGVGVQKPRYPALGRAELTSRPHDCGRTRSPATDLVGRGELLCGAAAPARSVAP
jgi:hypothetical protein